MSRLHGKYSRGHGPNGFPTKEQILKYDKRIEGDCWIYLGPKNKEGYGQKKVKGKMHGLHRIVAHVFHELDINNPKEFACHKRECISTSCFNPDHIYRGNWNTNFTDAFMKGTWVSPWKGIGRKR